MNERYDKREMSEEDVKRVYITPAIERKWPSVGVKMEAKVQFTDGRIILNGNQARRAVPKRVDYLLSLRENYPVAVVEAKDFKHALSAGLQQAIDYAKALDVPFAYASNGEGFREHDFLTGRERDLALDEFPTPEELRARIRAARPASDPIQERNQEKIVRQPYYSAQNYPSPRYYQRVAINKTLDAIARGRDRLLLVMATGTGKTYTAFQIVWRLLKSDLKRKILYLADRNILVDQSIQQDFSPLDKTIHKIDYSRDKPETVTAYEVYFALYQQLAGKSYDDEKDASDEETEGDAVLSRLKGLFKPNFFDFIIVDECHRGSAKRNSSWRKILEYFESATQLGMTATPKETKEVSNVDYFGEPVYTYSLRQGIEDGFLAPFRVHNVTLNISDGWRPCAGQLDVDGNPIEDRVYYNNEYDYKIIIEDRIREVARHITDYLKTTDPYARTIVFCADEAAALRMRDKLVELNSERVKENPDYVVRITGSDEYGKSKLDYFVSVSQKFPVIATTSKLLSTGVDCKMTKLIVIDENISSISEFKQILGRGTRLREKEGKTSFAVMDFRNVSRLFADPEWDGDVQIVEGFDHEGGKKGGKKENDSDGEDEGDDDKRRKIPIVAPEGCGVYVINDVVGVYDVDGNLLRVENLIDYTRASLRGEFASLEEFVQCDRKKEKIAELLKQRNIKLDELKEKQGMSEVDDFDFLCFVAFDVPTTPRSKRAENVRKRDFFQKFVEPAREVLSTLLDLYADQGIAEIEDVRALTLEPFQRFGGMVKIIKKFGGKDAYMNAVQELRRAIYVEGGESV